MERVRPKSDGSLGWAYRPDAVTVAALGRGRDKLKGRVLGFDRPHARGQLAGALIEEREVMETRRKKVAKKVSKTKVSSKKKTARAQPSKKGRIESKAPAKADGKSKSENGKMIALKSICADMDIDPKAARVKLRRVKEEGGLAFHDHNARWEFTSKQAAEVRAALTE